MKKLSVVFALAAISAMAADWTGYVMDEKCSRNKEMLGNTACAEKCIKGGSAAVLVTEEGKVYKIANQDKVTAHAGHFGHTGRRYYQSRKRKDVSVHGSGELLRFVWTDVDLVGNTGVPCNTFLDIPATATRLANPLKKAFYAASRHA